MTSHVAPCCSHGGVVTQGMATLVRPAAPVRTEKDLIQIIESGRGDSAFTEKFLALLDERHPIYTGAGTPAVVRMRGALLLALGHRALPTSALPFVLEELESAHEPWLTAVAAHVLRRHPEPSPAFVQPLLSALLYIPHKDDVVRLGNYGGHGEDGETTTATAEVLKTIGWLGSAGRACLSRLEALLDQQPGPETSALAQQAMQAIRDDTGAPSGESCGAEEPRAVSHPASMEVSHLRLQDHTGTVATFADVFHGHPSIVVFFYTRCDNPTKCPLTMYKFGVLQHMLRESRGGGSISTAAITYDPEYDQPRRLLQYALSWGVKPDAQHRILRTVDDHAALREYFELGVNYGESGIVNRHQLEAFVLDPDGRIAHVTARRRWDEAQLMKRAAALA